MQNEAEGSPVVRPPSLRGLLKMEPYLVVNAGCVP